MLLVWLFLTACAPPPGIAEFNITQGFYGGKDAIVTNGFGSTPESSVEIWIYNEPKFIDGEVKASPTPRLLGTVKTDQYGMFGFQDL